MGLGEPPDGFFVSIIHSDGKVDEYQDLDSCQDSSHMKALLIWMYQNYVNKIPGDKVYVDEGLSCVVRSLSVQKEPHWNATVKCFSVPHQDEVIVLFLKK